MNTFVVVVGKEKDDSLFFIIHREGLNFDLLYPANIDRVFVACGFAGDTPEPVF